MSIFQFVSVDILLFVLVIFGLIGFTRGARREFIVTLFILLGYLLTTWLFPYVVIVINRIALLTRIALSGALTAENPGQALANVDRTPLIANPDEATWLKLLVFGVTVWFGYWLSRRGKPVLTPVGIAILRRPPDILARLAGIVAGAVNGFLLLLYIVPRVAPGSQAILVVPTMATFMLQQRWLFAAVLALIAIVILVGWERARG
jgi:hypothetical protein